MTFKDFFKGFFHTTYGKILVSMLTTLFVIFVFNMFFVVVSGSSMEPTYHNMQIVPVKSTLFSSDICRNDVVIVRIDGKRLIKRVVGLPGETVTISNGRVYINGELLLENYDDIYNPGLLRNQPLVLDKNEYFLLGDNRNCSSDSRVFGPVKKPRITHVVKISKKSEEGKH